MEEVRAQLGRVMGALQRDLERLPLFARIERRLGVRASHLVVSVFALMFLLVWAGVAEQFLTNVAGFLYPMYASFRAVESTNKEDDTQWLMYLFSFFVLLDTASRLILEFMPLYFVFKMVFFFWLFLPQFRGALFLYHHAVAPLLRQGRPRFDAALKALSTEDSGGASPAAGGALPGGGATATAAAAAAAAAGAAHASSWRTDPQQCEHDKVD